MNIQKPVNLQFTTIKDPLPDFIYDGLKEFSAGANLYRPQPEILIQKIAQKYNLDSKHIYLTAGIDEAIQMFAKAYGKEVIVFTPTYSVYADVEIFGGKLNRMYSITNNTYSISPHQYPEATLIYLANPNNPSGFTPREIVLELIKNNPQAIVVIDEAYGEFGNLSVISEIEKYKNGVVFRSFSKAFGMAGNRLGFFVTQPEIIAKVKDMSQWANISYLSVGAACAAMDHEDFFIAMREGINKRRNDFFTFLKANGYVVFESSINAALIKFASESEASNFVNHLTKSEIIVSHGNGASNIGLDKTFVRIATGNEQQMEYLKVVMTNFSK